MYIDQITRVAEYIMSSNCISYRPDDGSFDFTFLPTGSNNWQMIMINDYNEYTLKLYERKRKDKDSPWNEWNFKGTLN